MDYISQYVKKTGRHHHTCFDVPTCLFANKTFVCLFVHRMRGWNEGIARGVVGMEVRKSSVVARVV